jgi:hypothetical protein
MISFTAEVLEIKLEARSGLNLPLPNLCLGGGGELKLVVFCHVMLSIVVDWYQHFGETCFHNLESRRVLYVVHLP